MRPRLRNQPLHTGSELGADRSAKPFGLETDVDSSTLLAVGISIG